jgi:colanic acid/amylovoran biosynthesis glycosyltransferase
MPRAAVFSTNFLDYSQTFVHQEVTHHTRYQVEVFCRRRMYPERFAFEPVHVGGTWYGLTRHSAAFHAALSSGRFDLVHGHFGTGSCYALPYVARSDLPLLVTFHGYDVPLLRSRARLWPQNWPYALLAPELLRRMTLGLCASQDLLDLLVSYGVPAERLRLYRLGIDLSRFRRGARGTTPRVLMVGRFVEKKGFEYGLRAFAACRARGLLAELVLVGTGEREAELRRLAAELALGDDAVRFAGVLSPAQVASLMADSDLLLAPSVVAADGDRESGVIAVKEASAAQLAVVGTQHGGIPEIIDDGVTGYLVPERDVDALRDRLAALLADAALRERMGAAGRSKMEREYDLRSRVAALEEHYDEAVDRKRLEGRRTD